MYINPLWAGILFTIIAEIILAFGFAVYCSAKSVKRDENK